MPAAAAAAGVLEQAGAAQQLDGAAGVFASLAGVLADLGPLVNTLSVDDLKAMFRTGKASPGPTFKLGTDTEALPPSVTSWATTRRATP